jgi:hypothetical protein
LVFLTLVFFSNLPLFPQFNISGLSGYRRVELKFYALSENPKTVAVAGDFSDWNTLQMEKKDNNSWVITLKVKPESISIPLLLMVKSGFQTQDLIDESKTDLEELILFWSLMANRNEKPVFFHLFLLDYSPFKYHSFCSR